MSARRGSNSPLFTVVVEIDDAFENTFDRHSADYRVKSQLCALSGTTNRRRRRDVCILFDVLFGSGVGILLFFFFFAIRYFFKLTVK